MGLVLFLLEAALGRVIIMSNVNGIKTLENK